MQRPSTRSGSAQPRLSLDEYSANLASIIRTLRADGSLPILMTLNPMPWSETYGDELRDPALGFDFDDPRGINRLLDLYSERVRELAQRERVPVLDVASRFEAYGERPGRSVDELLLPNDGIHPNDRGHALIAEWLTEIFVGELTQEMDACASRSGS